MTWVGRHDGTCRCCDADMHWFACGMVWCVCVCACVLLLCKSAGMCAKCELICRGTGLDFDI